MTTESMMRLPGHPRSVPLARRHVATLLRQAGVPDDTVDTVELIASEVITNAVIHAGGDFTVTVLTNGAVRVAVRDSSHRRPGLRQHDEESLMGRGLELVEMLADRYGVEEHADGGKSVWFVVGVPAATEQRSWALPTPTPTVEIALLSLPAGLYDVMRAYNEALLREYVISQLAEDDPGAPIAPDISVADRVRGIIAAEFHRLMREAADAPAHVDVRVTVPAADAAGAAAAFGPALRRAEELARCGRLLTPAAPAEVAALREWMIEQIESQARGDQPVAWSGLPQGLPKIDVPADRLQRAAGLMAPHTYAIVADRTDRIVGATTAVARLLGWDLHDLLGRTLTTIMPPEFRPAHIAGFARQVLTGEKSILGTELHLEAWHREGYGVPVTLFLERHVYPDDVLFLGILTA